MDATASVAPPNAPQSTYFDNLLQRGQKLDSNKKTPTTGLGELPSLQLGLGDISRRVRELGNAGNTAFEPKLQQARAKHLLAASGVQTVATVRDLQELGADISSEPYVTPEADIDADINYGYATSLLDMIDEANDRSIRDFDKWIAQEIKFDWEEQKRQIYEHFNLMPKTSPNRGDDRGSPSFERLGAFGKSGRRAATPSRSSPLKRGRESVFAASAAQRSVLGSASHVGAGQGSMFGQIDENSPVNTAGIDPTSKEKQHQYETKVRQLNDQRVRGDFYAVLENFAEVPAQLANGNQFNSQMHDCYRALAEITGESSSGPNPPDHQQVKQGMYATDYLDDVEMSERSTRMKKVITNGSRKYLERKCFAELEDLVQRNPREARLGGLPSVTAKVKAYVNVRSARKDLTKDGVDLQQLGDEPCWVVIFFLVRTGHVQEALEYVTSNQSAFRAIDRWFLAYIRDYANHPDRRLRREYQEKISTDYLARERISAADTLDPYRMAVYKVIGRCRLEQRSFEGLQTNMDDWVWLQFALARESSRLEESASETFGLTDVRGVIKEIGQRHFAKNSDANSIGTYFYLQMLAGIFEQAVAYLYAHDYVDAVHFAIALNFYGLLRVSSFSEPELLSFTVRGHGRLAFARMIGYYTRDFRAANVEAAVDYLTMIALNSHLAEPAGSSQAELCRDALRELVLETRAFSKLLGDAKKDGMKTPGLIEKRLSLVQVKKGDEKEFIRTLSIQAGNLADQNGRQKDAVLLMHLAGEYNQVIESINRMLSEVIAIELGQETPKISDPPVGQNSNGAGEQDSSLSLVDVQDPIQLAKNIVQLYDKDAIYYSHISPANKDACGTLLTMVEARSLVEAGKWMEAFEVSLIFPLSPFPQFPARIHPRKPPNIPLTPCISP